MDIPPEILPHVAALWRAVRSEGAFASSAMAQWFEAEEFEPEERALGRRLLFTMLRLERRAEMAWQKSGARLRPSPEQLLMATLMLAGDLSPGEAAQEDPAVDWAALVAADGELAHTADPARRMAVRHGLPDWLAHRLVREFGDAAPALVASLDQDAPRTLRANTLKTTREALRARLHERGLTAVPTAHAQAGLTVTAGGDLFGLHEFQDGWFEVQDEASQLVAELVAPPPGGVVVDLCAGAGGKSLALAALLGGSGRVFALDVAERKLTELRRRARRAGAHDVQAIAITAAAWPPEVAALAGKAHRVLVDAPCSGLGILRRNPELRFRLERDDLPRLRQQQLELLTRALPLVAPRGRLIYATCSLLAEENQELVAAFLAAHPELETVRAAEIWGSARAAPLCDASGTFLSTRPDRGGMDGFFAAVLRRKRAPEAG